MIIFLSAPDKSILLNDLSAYGLVSDGEFITDSHKHSLIYHGPIIDHPAEINNEGYVTTPETYLPGVYLSLRCLDNELIDLIDITAFPNGTMRVDKPVNITRFADSH